MTAPHDFPADVNQIARRVVWYLRSEGGCHTAGEICGALRISGRNLQHAIQFARAKGHKDWSSIISDRDGYRWDPTLKAAHRMERQINSRHSAMHKSIKGILRAAEPELRAMQENLDLTT